MRENGYSIIVVLGLPQAQLVKDRNSMLRRDRDLSGEGAHDVDERQVHGISGTKGQVNGRVPGPA